MNTIAHTPTRRNAEDAPPPVTESDLDELGVRLRTARAMFPELALAANVIDQIRRFERFPVPEIDPGRDGPEAANVESLVPWLLGVAFPSGDLEALADWFMAGGSACDDFDFRQWLREGASGEPPPLDKPYRDALNRRDALRNARTPYYRTLYRHAAFRPSPAWEYARRAQAHRALAAEARANGSEAAARWYEEHAAELDRGESAARARHERDAIEGERRCRYEQIARFGWGPTAELAWRSENDPDYTPRKSAIAARPRTTRKSKWNW